MKLSITELHNLTGRDRRRIRSALADLDATPGKKGALLYESREALPLLYIFPGAGDTLDLTQERARLAHHQANRAALEERKVQGELIEVQEVADIVGEDYANVRAKLLALPSKVGPSLQGLDLPEIHDHLKQAVDDALAELSAENNYN